MGKKVKKLVKKEDVTPFGTRTRNKGRREYILKRLSTTSSPERPATQAEAANVAKILCEEDESNCNLPCFGRSREDSPDFDPGPEKPPGPFSRRGGPCKHCGRTVSPQWRRGPPLKPILCNACGTRYRRTNQLPSFDAAKIALEICESAIQEKAKQESLKAQLPRKSSRASRNTANPDS